jgi:hypothetical protein
MERYLSLNRKDEDGTQYFKLKSNSEIGIITNSKNKVIRKAYFRGSKVGLLKVRAEFISTIQQELAQFLEECDENTKGEKLIVIYADSILRTVILAIKE